MMRIASALVSALFLPGCFLQPPAVAVPAREAFVLEDVIVINPARSRKAGQSLLILAAPLAWLSEARSISPRGSSRAVTGSRWCPRAGDWWSR